MSEGFPTVGLIGDSALQRMFAGPANMLGIEIANLNEDINPLQLANCTVVSVLGSHLSEFHVRTLESAGQVFRPTSSAMEFVKRRNAEQAVDTSSGAVVSTLVALSPHGQASAWTPTIIEIDGPVSLTTTPAPSLSASDIGTVQRMALEVAKESGAAGVVEVEMTFIDGDPVARRIVLGPTFRGVWTIEGARTCQFEQHLRAILDLPLGDPSQNSPFTVTGAFTGEGNMYRPYLHLMARSPALKIHQYLSGPGQVKGHVTAMGGDLLDLRECVTHAVQYMNGAIDE